MMREEQARAIEEFEATRQALEASRMALIEARNVAERAEGESRAAFEARLEESEQIAAELEEELQERSAELEERMRSNPDILRLARRSGERLVFVDEPGGRVIQSQQGPSIIVDGNRYQLNGRYQWVFEGAPEAPSPPDALGPKGPGDPEAPSEMPEIAGND
jgi:hypothetical protein